MGTCLTWDWCDKCEITNNDVVLQIRTFRVCPIHKPIDRWYHVIIMYHSMGPDLLLRALCCDFVAGSIWFWNIGGSGPDKFSGWLFFF